MPYFLCKFWQSTIWSSHAFVVRILPISHIPKPVFYFWSHMILSSLYPVLHLFPLPPLPLSSFQCFILVENFHWLQIVFRGYNQERPKRIIDHSIIPYILKSLEVFHLVELPCLSFWVVYSSFVEQISGS